MGLRGSLDAAEKRKISCPYQKSNPGHPTCNPSLYQLSYPRSENNSDIYCDIFTESQTNLIRRDVLYYVTA
jgi:hypothetical protein